MQIIKQSVFYTLMGLILLSTSACSAVLSKPSATPLPTQPPTATATDLPTRAPTAPPAPTATPEPTATITLTPTADVGADFSQAQVLQHGRTEHWDYFVTLKLPAQPKGDFYAVVNQNKKYACTLSTKFPTQLTCVGQMTAYNDYIDFVLFVKGYDTAIYTTRIFIPAELN